MVAHREHVAREARHGVGRCLLLVGFEAAADVLRFGGGIKRLRARLFQLALERGVTVVLGQFGRVRSGFGADRIGFVVEVFRFVHCIYLVKAWAVKSTMGTTRA